jgi:hypothetical protein
MAQVYDSNVLRGAGACNGPLSSQECKMSFYGEPSTVTTQSKRATVPPTVPLHGKCVTTSL